MRARGWPKEARGVGVGGVSREASIRAAAAAACSSDSDRVTTSGDRSHHHQAMSPTLHGLPVKWSDRLRDHRHGNMRQPRDPPRSVVVGGEDESQPELVNCQEMLRRDEGQEGRGSSVGMALGRGIPHVARGEHGAQGLLLHSSRFVIRHMLVGT